MLNSLKNLLNRFPYFLDKSSGSNLTRSEKVFNEQFIDIYNDLYFTYLASKLEKHLLIWKEQDEPYQYRIHFVSTIDDMASVTIQKNGTDIYTKQFNNSEDNNSFEYIYSSSSETVTPLDKFKIIIDTTDENRIIKGFPENDTKIGDEFDHDASLDQFGKFVNLARKNFVASSNLATTEPAYNAQMTEDDYHYMKRLVYYLEHIFTTPLEVLEVWKLYGIPVEEIKLVNRECLLGKMSDRPDSWVPNRNQHHDVMCGGAEKQVLFFATVNNNTPIQLQKFRFSFKVTDEFGFDVANRYFIVPFLNGEMVPDTLLLSDEDWTLDTSVINHNEGRFVFKLFGSISEVENEITTNNGVFTVNENDIVSDEITVTTRGCNSADWYVATTGDDGNDGKTRETAFATLGKALSMIEAGFNIITLDDGEYFIDRNMPIATNAKIIACPDSDVTITNTDDDKCFRILKECSLYLQNVKLHYDLHTVLVEDMLFKNNNTDNSSLNVTVDVIELVSVPTARANVRFTDDTPVDDNHIYIDTTTDGTGKWDIIISNELQETNGISVSDNSENPNTIIKDEREEE